jgi:hypothetical protein
MAVDSCVMDPHQRSHPRSILETNAIEIAGAAFRLGVSRLGGPDVLRGPRATRSPEEWKRFVEIVGSDPSTLSPSSVGKAMKRKIGDYDALHRHFGTGHDVFITLDTKDYLHISRRSLYKAQLNLIIQSPSEFVSAHSATIQMP